MPSLPPQIHSPWESPLLAWRRQVRHQRWPWLLRCPSLSEPAHNHHRRRRRRRPPARPAQAVDWGLARTTRSNGQGRREEYLNVREILAILVPKDVAHPSAPTGAATTARGDVLHDGAGWQLEVGHSADGHGSELVVERVDHVGGAQPLVAGLLPLGRQRAVDDAIPHAVVVDLPRDTDLSTGTLLCRRFAMLPLC
eukprot:scaffold2963_cov250-Pinguiococcus_pyrenoidosus.AAC.40